MDSKKSVTSYSSGSQAALQKIFKKFNFWEEKVYPVFKKYVKQKTSIFNREDEYITMKDVYVMLVNAEFDSEQIDRFFEHFKKDFEKDNQKKDPKEEKKRDLIKKPSIKADISDVHSQVDSSQIFNKIPEFLGI